MFGIGTWELIVILVLALIVLGPQKLPEVAKTLGRTMAKLRKAAEEVRREVDLDGLKNEIMQDEDLKDLKQTLDVRGEVRRAMAHLQEPVQGEPSGPPQLQLPPDSESSGEAKPTADEKKNPE